MKKRLAVLLVLVCAAGCLVDYDTDGTTRIGCAGDSNTAGVNSWCDRAQVLLPEFRVVRHPDVGVLEPVQFIKRAFIGYPACNNGAVDLSTYLVETKQADVVVVALGSNDLIAFGYTPAEMVACLEAAETYLGQRQLFVALVPPVYAPYPNVAANNALIDQTNTLIRAAFPIDRVVDFHDGFTVDLYAPDGLHFNEAGQQKRAERVVEALKRPGA